MGAGDEMHRVWGLAAGVRVGHVGSLGQCAVDIPSRTLPLCAALREEGGGGMEEPGGGSQQEMGLQLAHFIICEKYSWPGLCPDVRLWSLRYAPSLEGVTPLGCKPRDGPGR